MSKEQLYQKVRERICELVPRLNSLCFGCEVKFPNESFPYIYLSDDRYIYTDGDDSVIGNVTRKYNNHKYIIGHEPHLEDILEAIDGNGGVGAKLNLHKKSVNIYDNVKMIKTDYNLSISLKDQTEETLEAIYDLIK